MQVLQASDIPVGVVSVISGGKDQLTQALANHNEIQAVWYWGSLEVGIMLFFGQLFVTLCLEIQKISKVFIKDLLTFFI